MVEGIRGGEGRGATAGQFAWGVLDVEMKIGNMGGRLREDGAVLRWSSVEPEDFPVLLRLGETGVSATAWITTSRQTSRPPGDDEAKDDGRDVDEEVSPGSEWAFVSAVKSGIGALLLRCLDR
jgi:hypothetical protein